MNAEPQDTLGEYGDVDGVPAYASDKSLDDVLSGAGIFRDFRTALAAMDSGEVLNGSGPYTLFVPGNDAFAKLPAEQQERLRNDPQALAELISRHLVPGRYSATDLMQMREARTLDGTSVAVGPTAAAAGNIAYGDARVVKTNIHAANGIIHVLGQRQPLTEPFAGRQRAAGAP